MFYIDAATTASHALSSRATGWGETGMVPETTEDDTAYTSGLQKATQGDRLVP
jgi:hypothetical protein